MQASTSQLNPANTPGEDCDKSVAPLIIIVFVPNTMAPAWRSRSTPSASRLAIGDPVAPICGISANDMSFTHTGMPQGSEFIASADGFVGPVGLRTGAGHVEIVERLELRIELFDPTQKVLGHLERRDVGLSYQLADLPRRHPRQLF